MLIKKAKASNPTPKAGTSKLFALTLIICKVYVPNSISFLPFETAPSQMIKYSSTYLI